MLDPVILLTPLLVLAVMLLLGFAGCERIFGLSPLSPELCLKVRVPAALTVTAIKFGWRPPGGEQTTFPREPVTPVPDSTEDGDNVFSHCISNAAEGSWTVACWVTVSASGLTAQADRECMVKVEETSDYTVATFQAGGSSPATFFVACSGQT